MRRQDKCKEGPEVSIEEISAWLASLNVKRLMSLWKIAKAVSGPEEISL
jgi:hypothetical protein